MTGKHNSRSKKSKEATAETRLAKEDLDRFAGSSGEESGNDDGGNDHNIDIGMEVEDEHSDVIDNDDNNDDSDEEEEKELLQATGSAGMVNAMARILGAPTKVSGTQSVILSKTKTPLQKLAEKEKEQEKELREKRRLNRDKHLQALHVPLSVATTAHIQRDSASQAISKELEEERAFRRIATRGIVALFNAISQHQKKPNDIKVEDTSGGQNKDGKAKKMNKRSFLDMIKAKASAETAAATKSSEITGNDKISQQGKGKQWDALKDDFMLNPKRNWDQESSDEEAWEQVGESDREHSSKQQRFS